jgi:alpha-tubulin suppressor-like RCC1 family protein
MKNINKKKIRNSFELQYGGDMEIRHISCGALHTFISTKNNDIYACGNNEYGQLGLGNNINQNKFVKVNIEGIIGNIKEIYCGTMHTFILMGNGEMYACGYNGYGQLGLNNYISQYSFVKVNIDENIKQISCGLHYTIILTENNNIYVCGDNGYGQLGLDHTNMINKFQKVNIEGMTEIIKKISCGAFHTFILMENNDIYVSGKNDRGQLGLGYINTINKFIKVYIEEIEGNIKNINCGYMYTFILTENNDIYAVGLNSFGQLGLGHFDTISKFKKVNVEGNIKQISCGESHSIILTKNNKMYACGNNKSGQISFGNIDRINRFTKINIEGNIKQIDCGFYHTFVLMENNEIYASGQNNVGQLGLGHDDNKNKFVKVNIEGINIQQNVERQLFQSNDRTPTQQQNNVQSVERELFDTNDTTPIYTRQENGTLIQQENSTPIQQQVMQQEYPEIIINLDKNNIFEQLYIFFNHNIYYLNDHYWKKINLPNFPEAIKLRFEFNDERGVDYGGIRGKVFYKIKEELSNSSLSIFFCGTTEDFVCVGSDNKNKLNYNYCYFLGQILALFYKNNLNLNWAPNPFLAFKLLFDNDLDEYNLKQIISYCYCIKTKFNLRMYTERHDSLFKKICNKNENYNNCIDDDLNCHEDNNIDELENLGVLMNYSDIIKFEYYENPSNFKYIDQISEGFKSISKPKILSKNTKDNIRYIDEFIRTLYGDFDVKIDLILDNIDITGNFDNLSNEESSNKIKSKIKEYLENDDKPKINKARKLYGYFTGNLALDYNKKLSISIMDIINEFEEHSCANNVCLKSTISNIDDYLNGLIMNIDTYTIEGTKTQIAGYRSSCKQNINYKKKYLKYFSKFYC